MLFDLLIHYGDQLDLKDIHVFTLLLYLVILEMLVSLGLGFMKLLAISSRISISGLRCHVFMQTY